MPDDITLHTACPQQVTCVSNIFIDHYMVDADGEYVKIYLYLLRALSHNGTSFSMHRMADELGHTERDIRRALSFWEEKKLLRMEYDTQGNPVGICMLDPSSETTNLSIHVTMEPAPEKVATPVETPAAVPVTTTATVTPSIPEKPSFSKEERAAMNKEDSTKELLYVTEQFVGKPLSRSEADTVLFWHWTLGLSVDLIEYLVEQCANNGHVSLHYMNAIALQWKQQGITTEAEAKLQSDLHSQSYYTVVKGLGISGRNLNPSEEKFLKHWTQDFGFSNEILAEACDRTIRSTGKASFSYADKILSSWFAAGVHSIKDIAALDQTHASRAPKSANRGGKTNSSGNSADNFHNFTDRGYNEEDFDSFEEKLLHMS